MLASAGDSQPVVTTVDTTERNLLIDLLKLFAVQVIILHHLVSYGKIAADAELLLPTLSSVIFEYGRYLVHGFLVIGGYLAARSLRWRAGPIDPIGLIVRRYFRLVPPYLGALTLAMLSAWFVRHWITEDYVGGPVTLGQLAAHVALLQDMLGLESISAGGWYVAIDFQLFAFLAIVHAVVRGEARLAIVMTACMFATLLYFNNDPRYESFFVYFVSSYGLGVLAGVSRHARLQRTRRLATALIILVGAAIVILAAQGANGRSVVALATAILLLGAPAASALEQLPPWLHTLIRWGGNRSYAAFLLHYSWILLANLIYSNIQGVSGWSLGAAPIGVYAVTWWSADWFYRHFELRVNQWFKAMPMLAGGTASARKAGN